MIMSLALLPDMDTFSSCWSDDTSVLTTAGGTPLLVNLLPPSDDLEDEEAAELDWRVTLGMPAV